MTNKTKLKKAVCVVLAAFGVLYIVNSCRPIDSHAYDLPPGTTTITASMLYNIIGNAPTCYYVGADNQWVKVSGSPYRSETITGAGTTSYPSNVWNGRAICWYAFPIPSQYATNTVISPIGMLETNLHFSNVTYVDFGFVGHTSNKYLNLPVGTVRPYCYLDYYVSGSESIMYAASDTTGEHMGSLNVASLAPPNYNYFCAFDRYEGSATDFYYTSVTCACLRQYSGENVLIGVPEIIINSDYVLELNGAPPSGGGGSPSVSVSGTLSGTVGDSPVNVIVDVEQNLPDYFYNGGDAPVYDDGGYSHELAPVIDEADNAYEVVQDGLEVLGEMPILPAWNYLESILSIVPAFKALMIAAFILALYGWTLYR